MCLQNTHDRLVLNIRIQTKLVSSGKWNLTVLSEEVDSSITPEMLEIYRKTAKFQFECGDYQRARDMLETYISLLAKPPTPENNAEEDEIDD